MDRGLVRRGVASLCCFALAGSASAASDGRPFTFRDAEFLQPAQGLSAATTFVDTDLPPGLAMSEARRRAMGAAMVCGPPRSLTTVCEYSLPIHVEGGLIGEDRWRVTLTADESDTLRSTQLKHYSIGQPNPQ